MTDAARRLIRAVKILAHDGRIPKPLRGLAVFGVLPIPGPFDEGVLVVVGLLLWLFYRNCLGEAWSRAAAVGKVTGEGRALRGARLSLSSREQSMTALKRAKSSGRVAEEPLRVLPAAPRRSA